MRMIVLSIVSICVAFSQIVFASDRRLLIVGSHIREDSGDELGRSVRNNVNITLSEIQGPYIFEETPLSDFLNEMKASHDEKLNLPLSVMNTAYQSSYTTALLMMAGTYVDPTIGTRSLVFLGPPNANFRVIQAKANLSASRNFPDESQYLKLLISYAIVKEASRAGGDPRAVAIPVARRALEWADGMDELKFPELSTIKSELVAVLP